MLKTALPAAVIFALVAMTACNGGTASKDTVDTAMLGETVSNAVVMTDEAQPSSSETDTIWNELERLTDEIYDGHPLEPEEWAFIFDHIDMFDGYLAEGFGYDLESDGLAGTGCTGYEAVAVRHLGAHADRAFV